MNFVSDDRLVAAKDGTSFTLQRWSTPLRDYADVGPYAVATHGEGHWHPPEGAFSYLEIDLLSLEVDPT